MVYGVKNIYAKPILKHTLSYNTPNSQSDRDTEQLLEAAGAI